MKKVRGGGTPSVKKMKKCKYRRDQKHFAKKDDMWCVHISATFPITRDCEPGTKCRYFREKE